MPNTMVDISPVDALWAPVQNQTKAVRKALIKRLLEEDEKNYKSTGNCEKKSYHCL